MNAFIFDLDGVLVDTAKYHFLAWQALCQKCHYDFDQQFNEQLKGVSRATCLELILEHNHQHLSADQKQHYLAEKNQTYLNYIAQISHNDLLPGVMDVLQYCQAQHIAICLGSASKNARLILDKLAITPYFDVIIDGNDVTAAKPDPDVFYQSCVHLDIAPQACVVFEDSVAGLQAAKSVHMKAVGIGSAPELKIADVLISSLADFTPALLNN